MIVSGALGRNLNANSVVLVCENPFIEKYLDAVLGRIGRQAIFMGPRKAIEMVKSGQHRIALLITNAPADFLPLANDLPFLYLSAAPDHAVAASFPRLRILQKPFRMSDLVSAVNELLAAS